MLVMLLALSACASFGNSSTPTPEIPTATPLPPTATPVPAAATVNGEGIPVAEFQAELKRYQAAQTALGLTVSDADAQTIVLDDMIAQVLLSQAAREQGFSLSDTDLQARMDSLAAQIGGTEALTAWQTAHGYDDASFRVSLKRAAEAAWMRDTIAASVPASAEQIHVRQILTYNEADAGFVLERLNNGSDFDELAASYDPATRGELGWIPRGYLLDARAEEAVFALQAGQISGVIGTAAGFHVFKALERGERPLSPDALLLAQELALKNWVADRRAAAAIVLAP